MVRHPDPDEAAAITSAVQRFLTETAGGQVEEPESPGAWQRAALLEGVAGKATIEDLESRGGAKWLS
jgi:hypothetical protein